jgi:parallel beta-helix repeat protein
MKKFLKLNLLLLLLSLAIIIISGSFIYTNKTNADAYPILINEFVSNPATGNEWVELFNPNESSDIVMENYRLESGNPASPFVTNITDITIPALGIVVIEYAPGDNLINTGDVIALYDVATEGTPISAVSYGLIDPPGSESHLATAPASGESGYISTYGNPPTYSITATPTRGWFNNAEDFTCPGGVLTDPGNLTPPTLSSVDACLAESPSDITTNIGEIADPSAAENLYFEKSIEDSPVGRITFDGPLNLTDQDTVAYLQSIGEKMEASQSDGEVVVGLNTYVTGTTESDFKTTAATITMYGLTGISSAPNLIVKDNDGEIIPATDPAYPDITNPVFDDELNTFTFDTDHFTTFETDSIAPTLSATSASDVTTTTATLNFTTNEAGTYYYLVYLAPSGGMLGGFPNAAKVKAQGTAITKGTASTLAEAKSINVTGLSASVSYNAYIIVEDAAGNLSAVSKIPFATTIQGMINAAEAGDTITVPAGTYTEIITINKKLTLIGDIGDDVLGAGSNAPVIDSGDGDTRTINITASEVTFKGFVVNNNGIGYPAVRIAPNVASTTISNNDLHYAYVGVGLAPNSHNNTVTKNKIYDNVANGIIIGGSINNTISYNEIYSNSTGIYLAEGGCDDECVSTVGGNNINHNNIHNNSNSGIDFESNLDTTDGTVLVDSNTIDSNDGAGIYIYSGTSGVSIQYNTITNNGTELTPFTGIHIQSASGNSAHYNIISDNKDNDGITNTDEIAFDATQNYWGMETGPYEEEVNPTGNASSTVVGLVNYSPWYGDADLTSLRGIPDENNTYTITQDFFASTHDYDLNIASGTVATGTSTWTGELDGPSGTTILNPPSRDGYTTNMGQAIELGFSDGKLILSKAAKLTFPGEHGKKVGYTRPGLSFTEIATTCDENSGPWADENLGEEGDCKIDVDEDLVVWTKHFTQFATYTQTQNTPTSSSGGGSVISYAVDCASVIYGEWGNCVNGMQYRNYISQSPNGCVLTASQRLAANRACQTVTPTSPTESNTTSAPTSNMLEDIMSEAKILATEDTNQLLNHLGIGANIANEQAGLIKYKTILDLDKTISANSRMTINDFIIYGTLSTKHLGAGERAAVINSYYQAYGKLPNSEAEWSDVLKIANGRWPNERNTKTEAQAKLEFKKVYARDAVMANNVDENAISDRIAITTFKWVYGHNPANALAWNIVRAIAYSGAKR